MAVAFKLKFGTFSLGLQLYEQIWIPSCKNCFAHRTVLQEVSSCFCQVTAVLICEKGALN